MRRRISGVTPAIIVLFCHVQVHAQTADRPDRPAAQVPFGVEQNDAVFYVTSVEHLSFVQREGEEYFEGFVRVGALVRSQINTSVEIRLIYPPVAAGGDQLLLDLIATAAPAHLNVCEFSHSSSVFTYRTEQPVGAVRVRGSINSVEVQAGESAFIEFTAPSCDELRALSGTETINRLQGMGVRARLVGPADGIDLRETDPNRASVFTGSDGATEVILWQ